MLYCVLSGWSSGPVAATDWSNHYCLVADYLNFLQIFLFVIDNCILKTELIQKCNAILIHSETVLTARQFPPTTEKSQWSLAQQTMPYYGFIWNIIDSCAIWQWLQSNYQSYSQIWIHLMLRCVNKWLRVLYPCIQNKGILTIHPLQPMAAFKPDATSNSPKPW